jgi:hypothetical protein
MQRRKLLATIGSMAAGGAALTSTGAFTQVDAQRKLTGKIVKDGQAQLGLKTDGQNGEYASYNERGRLVIDVPDLNSKAITTLGGVFKVVNQTGTDNEENGETVHFAVQEDLDTPANGFCTFFAGDPPTIDGNGRISDENSIEVESGGTAVELKSGHSTLVGIQFGIGNAHVGDGPVKIGGPFRLVATTGDIEDAVDDTGAGIPDYDGGSDADDSNG